MARYSAEQIYAFARKAQFSPDAAATMTAIALAESGGNSRAHNPRGEDSRGLWQINASAHPDLARRFDLFDPLANARAAFDVSRGGADVSPWTVTHGGAGARYTRYREAAQAAAVAHGDGPGRGSWSGTSGYGSVLAASTATTSGTSSTGAAASTAADTSMSTAGPAAEGTQSPALKRFLEAAMAQEGDRYVFGAETRLDDADPDAFDCSELVQWAAAQAGVQVEDGASAQYLQAKRNDWLVDVETARNTPGALLFSFSSEPRPGGGRPAQAHVAISLGDGRTIEARNSRVPVGIFQPGMRFGYAAVIPGLSGKVDVERLGEVLSRQVVPAAPITSQTAVGAPVAPASLAGPDTDRDGMTDVREQRAGLDATRADTDEDGLSDGSEVAEGTSPLLADTDGDLLPDAFEIPRGSDPTDPDSDRDGHLDGALASQWRDSDSDGVDDPLEVLLRLDLGNPDTDGDGFTDDFEHRSGFDPADRLDLPGQQRSGRGDELEAGSTL